MANILKIVWNWLNSERSSDDEREASDSSWTTQSDSANAELCRHGAIEPQSVENSENNLNSEETLPNHELVEPNCLKADESLPSEVNYSEDCVNLAKHGETLVDNKTKYASLLNDLNLNPEIKLTRQWARTVNDRSFDDIILTSSREISEFIVEKLMLTDYRARAFKLNHNLDPETDEIGQGEEIAKNRINPMDAFLAIFHCSDDFLRQDLVLKLSACQLSVPFLLPSPLQPSEKVTMLLWALEGVKKSWKVVGQDSKNPKARQVFTLDHPFPIVSFVRIGKNPISKSVLINKVMSDLNGYHDFFFHKDCRGGGIGRKIVDGLVELCWYLPGERKQQAFQVEVCFANLRGDSGQFQKQLNVLAQISSVIFVLVSSECCNCSNLKIFDDLAKRKAHVVLIMKEKPGKEAREYFRGLKHKFPGRMVLIVREVQENEDDFVEIIRQKIQKNLNAGKVSPLAKLSSFVDEFGVDLDENSEVNLMWRKNIEEWIKMGPKEAKQQLKLQRQVPIIANLERENLCPKRESNKTENERIDEIHSKMENTKECQRKAFDEMDENICKILNRVAVMNETERSYALIILGHQLDKMSLEVLGSLQSKYRNMCLSMQKKKKLQRQDIPPKSLDSRDQELLKNLEESIVESSFGIEHIVREIAQLFQLTEISPNNYAGAAADILLSGHPLELMDGDSSYIPMRWFDAVFNKLQHKTKDAKIFVISVLGIQSSGKSTMLNTMFGLEFPVSAGRCTRGAFASLIPVSTSLKSVSDCDYILVVDTEGLRGSGDPHLREHDNELATFAIGVADLTIVNIFGENYNEMKEFLEIAVHAFLKMKLVKEKRICQIVHQNVAAVEASDSLATERIALKQKLDEMAKLAAIQENCEDEFQELNDILSFDENEDVFYIPSLLQGSPPMAPVNPDYGQAIQKVKQKIISVMCSSEKLSKRIFQFQKRVCELWKAILRENFIFSFRNTIEIRAYTSLDRKYFEESVKTMVTGMAELEKRIQVSLMRSSPNDREAIWDVGKVEIRDKAAELGTKMEKAMEVFFETNEDKATLEQWRENAMLKIVHLKDTQEMLVRRNCEAAFHYWQSRQEVDMRKQTCENELLAKARKFITSVGNTNDAEKCKAAFDLEWRHWIKDVPPCKEIPVDVNKAMIEILIHTDSRLKAEMSDKCKAQNNDIKNFKDFFPLIKTQLNIGKVRRFVSWFWKNPQLLIDAKGIRDQAINAAHDFARKALRSNVRCRPEYLIQMYHEVITVIENGTKSQPFKFPYCLICDILLYAFANTFNDFLQMERQYIQERDIRGELERSLRPRLENYFLNKCREMNNEMLAATSMLDVLKTAIEHELSQSMGVAVARELLKKTEYQSKGQFHATVLIELGEKCNFSGYVSYLGNPVKFLREKLIESIENLCYNTGDNLVALVLENEVKKIEDKVFAALLVANQLTKTENASFLFWIQRFVENCSTFAITTEMFAVAAIDDDLKEFQVFEDHIRQSLTKFLQSLIDRGIDRNFFLSWNPTPHDKLLDLMFGCQACCPFCRGLCDQTIGNHEGGHSTRIHRPQGVTGYHEDSTKILENRICTTMVASDWRFKNIHTSDNWHPYKEYQSVNEYYKSWSIAPDPSFEASTYWKWLMATFAQDLANHYQVKPPTIPVAWKNIPFKEARRHLCEEYNLL